ncbi:acetyl-CoA C-acyltransferase [Cytophaga hutchinsonii]|uniref:Acetyl-CoA acetyltransferase n=1 Tax=Cytophaga hutchinsonii (strain ATCC 33406 / DSM 1761 / CIP 103989 / NBRC 15051 / NCIMB 9469 / D465) TaxID=269798 RepID=A0A6N4SRY7_CYTH3|nr:acetyl-CoA C-acyltransferase [Cytophaga hutchinsonii]ABG59176.1 acetyl-CoA acetyltransferase [Cytophaga hutchinsonii ATCC 33406]SFX34904.1 acetyl-CoA C-acetyltransferase [Cytophaga hutchinsonii ATCC 33406]
MKPVYIVAASRTPIGSLAGSLSSLNASQLGAAAIKGCLNNLELPLDAIQNAYMGNVLSAGLGQSPARQASKFAGLPDSTEATTINKVCASGMKAIQLGTQQILCGDAEIVVAGGMESMSNVPYYLDKARQGYKLGNAQVIDGIIKDGLWDVYYNCHMGNAAENTAKELHITREMQDAYAIESYKRSASAWQNGSFKNEIVPVNISGKPGQETVVDTDEEFSKVNFDKIPQLKPVFDKEGTVTAANASSINDGAAALILVSEDALKKYNLTPIARILSYADAAQDPLWFTTAPVLSVNKALEKAGLNIQDIDYFELNEAFAVVCLAINNKLGIDSRKANVWGGAVSLGHPIGASGARIVVTLVNILKTNNARLGVAGICNGGGGSSALVIENLA